MKVFQLFKRRSHLRVAVAAIALISARATFAQEAEAPPRTIANIRGDLYLMKDGQEVTVFLVTADGIILADPLNQSAAVWLKEELARRFPDRPVRFVLFSHHHADRAIGASVFDATAELVGHRDFNSEAARARRAQPGLYGSVMDVESSYSSRRTITVGGKSVELVHTGPAHSKEMTALYFQAERLVFAVDVPPIAAVPFSFGSMRVVDVRTWVHTITALDFDTLLTGRGETIARKDIVSFGAYLDELMSSVAAGYERGLTLAQLQATPLIGADRARAQAADRNGQIAYIYRTARFMRADVYGAALLNIISRNSSYCVSFATCSSGAVVPAGTVGISVANRHLGGVAEIRLGGQSLSSRTSPMYDDEFARRDTVLSFLLRYSSSPKGGVSFSILAGPSIIVGDVRGQNDVKEGFAPFAGRHAIAVSDANMGVTAGADLVLSVGGGVSILVPVRLTTVPGEQTATFPGRLDVHAGIGLRFNVFRRIG